MKNLTKSQFPSLNQDIEDLKEIINQYEELLELAQHVIFTLSPGGLVIALNNIFQKVTGWQDEEWIGKPFEDMLHPGDVPLAIERFSNLLNGNAAQSIEVRIQKKTGGFVFCEILAGPKIKDGKAITILGIGRDITRRKLADEALIESEERFRTKHSRSYPGTRSQSEIQICNQSSAWSYTRRYDR
jgi:two-component system, sporulation sensor kinase E